MEYETLAQSQEATIQRIWGLSQSQAPTPPKSLALARTSLPGTSLPERVNTPDVPVTSTMQMPSHSHVT